MISGLTQPLEFEQALLGAVFLENDLMNALIPILEIRDFQINAHRLIWRAMRYQNENEKPIDFLTIAQMLMTYKRLDEVGGISYLSNLAGACPSPRNAIEYAGVIRSAALRRRGQEVAAEIMELSQAVETDDESYFQKVEQLASSLRPNAAGMMRHVKDTRKKYLDYLERRDETILSGFTKFDEWSGGIGRGWLYIIAGRPSVGKTARILQQAINMGKQDIGEILIWSQEMNEEQLKNRMLSPIAHVHIGRIRKKTFEPHELERIKAAYDEIEKLPLHIEDSSGVSIEHIAATARHIKREFGRIGAIIVDYLTIMDIKQEKGQTWSKAVGEVTKKAKRLARELDCPFFMLAQLSREGAGVEPQLHHLRDSGEIEQDADVVEFLWEDPEEKPASSSGKIIQSCIAKGREIGVENFKYLFEGWLQKYSDYDK